MAFIEDITNKLERMSESTVQKAKDISEQTRLNSQISSARKQIRELYGQIGYEIYCRYKDNPLPEAAELIARINQLSMTIEASEKQIRMISGQDVCPVCRTKNKPGSAFCASCGARLEKGQDSPAIPSAPCPNCGTPVSADSLFCPSCGQKIR